MGSISTLSNVKKMVLFHHDPINKDIDLENMLNQSIENKKFNYELILGKENDSFVIQ